MSNDQKEFEFRIDVTIIAFTEQEAIDIQERIATMVFEEEDVIQIWTDRIDESNTVTSKSR